VVPQRCHSEALHERRRFLIDGHRLHFSRFQLASSPDKKRSAQQLFKPGKNHDGYFTNEDIQEQAQDAMDIILECYLQFDHVFIYDKVTTHLKWR
jgi:hypothetical protein